MIVESVMSGILANYLYDLSKSFSSNVNRELIENEVGNFLEKYQDTSIDSGAFDEFLKLTETKIDFENFVEYGRYKDSCRQVEDVLTKEEFISKISKKASSYIKLKRNSKLKSIDLEEIEEYFTFLMEIIEKKIIANMSKDLKYNHYLIRIKIEELIERLNIGINSNVTLKKDDIEAIKIKYIKMMKGKYKKAHIYGIDELEYDSFYIKPKFIVSKKENDLEPIDKIYDNNKDELNVNWSEIFCYSNIVSIVGGAGFGKTSFLKNMIHDYKNLNTPQSNNLIPIYCDLKKFVENRTSNMGYTIEDFLVDSMKYDTSIKEINQSFLKYFLEKGQCIILFDALDEVESSERTSVYELIVNFFEHINKNNKVCITSRERGFIPKTNITYRVKPVDENQAIEYIDKMIVIKVFNIQDKDEFIRECIELINIDFLKSLLMLSLLMNIYRAEKRIPKNKIDLYKKSIEYISKEREIGRTSGCPSKSKIDFDLIGIIIDTDQSFCELSNLAKRDNREIHEDEIKSKFLDLYDVSYKNQNEALKAIKEFLKFCAERTELFVKSGENTYKFYHKSFFEYFYSKYIINNFKHNQIYKELVKFDYSQDIPEITIELLKESKFSTYKELIIYAINESSKSRIKFYEGLNILLYVDEPIFLRNMYDKLFTEKKLLIQQNPIFENDSLSAYNEKIWEVIKLNLVISNIFECEGILDDKDINGDIRRIYSKEEYLKVMYYKFLQKSDYVVLSKVNYNGLLFIHNYMGNIFTKEDFEYEEILKILYKIDIKSENIISTDNKFNTKDMHNIKEKVILEFYNDVYCKTLIKMEMIESEFELG